MTKQYALKCTIYVDVFEDEDVDDVCDSIQRDVAGYLGLPINLEDVEEVTE